MIVGLRRSIVRLWERGFGPMSEEARKRLEAVKEIERVDHVLDQVSGAGSIDEIDL